MANTVMTAKNTFAEGLIMDFSPDNTQASCMTSALNATVLTFNGNEMSLLNDMGNGRVETAYLPEGYVPVGTCEFGDIIYIVSYNPIINKSQIGCFPSPERNISSDEVGGLGQSLRWTDFLGSNGDGPNGEIVASSVKKILYGTKDMTSGDKYIIYSAELDSAGNHEHLSDYGNTSHLHERFPKLVKIHVVSIEESGKITYLDSSTKWYKENDFYILNSRKIVDKPDLDSYRTMVSSAYSIFSSKVSGKLALLIELEKISGFSCTWSAYTKEINNNPDLLQNEYSIYWNFSWNTEDNNINPNAVVLTQSKWTGENNTYAGKYLKWFKESDGWVLGGKDNNWEYGPYIPIAYPNYGYNYLTISRVYKPESYGGSFLNFINSDSYEAQSKSILSSIKLSDLMPNVELTKVNLARKADGTPDVGKYYFNCSSSSSEKGVVAYYTNYNNKLVKVDPNTMSDDIINNKFNYPIVKHFANFTIPIKLRILDGNKDEWKDVNINNLIYYYELTPAMPYGLLREFSLDGYIDFKKIGTKSIKLNSWRYYNYENTSTLTWGLEAYTEPNKGISEVVFLFYDNLEKPAAAYHNSGKISYNGKFTEYFTLNTSGTNYKLNNKDESNKPFYHKGLKVSKEDATISNTYLDENGNVISIKKMKDGVDYYLNDAGTLYSNCLYLVKIIVKYCNIGVLDEYIEDTTSYIEDYRWYWTNTMFNEYYQSVPDFKGLLLSLNLDSLAMFETVKEKWEIKRASYGPKFSYTEYIGNSDAYKSLSSNVQYINQDGSLTGNVRMAIRAGLLNDYNTFNIKKESINNINARIFLAKEYMSNSPEQPSVIFSKTETTTSPIIFPTTAKKLTGKVDNTTSKAFNELVGSPILGTGEEMYDSKDAYEKYTNNFHLEPVNSSTRTGNYNGKLSYIDSNGELVEISDFTEYSVSLDLIVYDEENGKIDQYKAFPMTLSGIYHSKYYYTTEPTELFGTLRSFVVNTEDLEYYALKVNSGTSTIQFRYMLLMALGNRHEGDEQNTMISGSVVEFDKNICTGIVETLTPINSVGTTATKDEGKDNPIQILLFLSYNSDKIGNKLHFLFPIGFGYNYMGNLGDIRNAFKGSENGPSLATPKRILTGSYTNDNLAGTLGGITTSGIIEPGDLYTKLGWGTSTNALTAFTSVVLGYLTLFFYLEDSTYTILAPSNIAYLDSNNLYYNRDVVVELSAKKGTDMSSLLTFRQNWNYDSYVSSILSHFNGILHELVSKSASNVYPVIHSSLKTSPLLFKFMYEIPKLYLDLNLGTRTLSIYDEIPEYVNAEFLPNTIYYWNKEQKAFKGFKNTDRIYDINYTIEDSKIKGTMSNTTHYLVKEVLPVLQLTGNRLSLSSVPNNFSGTYDVYTWKGKEGYMEDFKTNLKYYRKK